MGLKSELLILEILSEVQMKITIKSFRSSADNYSLVDDCDGVSQKIHFQTYNFISKNDTQMSLYKIHFVSRTIRDETRTSHRN